MLTRGTAGGCEVWNSHAAPSLVCTSVNIPTLSEGLRLAAVPLRMCRWRVRAVEFYDFYSGGAVLQAGDSTAAIYLILRVLRPQEMFKCRTGYEMR